MAVAWHAQQYQSLPTVYVQNSSLEIAWTYVVERHRSREGRTVGAFLTKFPEGFAIDSELDWEYSNLMVQLGEAHLPEVEEVPS